MCGRKVDQLARQGARGHGKNQRKAQLWKQPGRGEER
jgi:hypothetical protein